MARRQLATEGAAALSLRAVARELGMVSSAIYRYVPSRDDLLTLLIVDAYDALGSAAERAEARVNRADLTGRFSAVCVAVRRWALKNPHEYALIYGSPVPGYQAPELTIGPATRVAVLLGGIAAASVGSPVGPAAGTRATADRAAGDRPVGDRSVMGGGAVDPAVSRAIAPVRAAFPSEIPDDVIVRWLMAWTYLFGAISFELFGHRHGVVAPSLAARDAFFAEEVSRLAQLALGAMPMR